MTKKIMFCHVQIAARLRFKANVTALPGARRRSLGLKHPAKGEVIRGQREQQ